MYNVEYKVKKLLKRSHVIFRLRDDDKTAACKLFALSVHYSVVPY